MDILEKIKNDMYSAMKLGNKEHSQTLRILLSKLKDYQINNKKLLTESEGINIIKTLVKQRKESIKIYQNAERFDLMEKEKFEVDILSMYLPKMMNEHEIKSLVKSVIDEVNAKNLSDIGKVMPLVMKRGEGKIEGKIANLILRQLLE